LSSQRSRRIGETLFLAAAAVVLLGACGQRENSSIDADIGVLSDVYLLKDYPTHWDSIPDNCDCAAPVSDECTAFCKVVGAKNRLLAGGHERLLQHALELIWENRG